MSNQSSARAGPFHGDVAQRRIKLRKLRRDEIQDLRRQRSAPRAGLHQRQFNRPSELHPHLVKLPREQLAKKRAGIHARKIIPPRLLLGLGVVAKLGMVEAGLHIFSESDGTMSTDAFGDDQG